MIRVFPVAAPTRLSNDFGAARSGGRGHQGNDLFATEGSPLVAVDDGEVRSGTDPLGGNILNLYASDNTKYYYAHLSGFADGSNNFTTSPPPPKQVRTGDLVGFLGKTGNAATTEAHLHFEEHPLRGPAIDPYPALAAAARVSLNQSPARARASSGRSPLIILVAAAAAGVAVWALLQPHAAERTVRRLMRA